MIMDSLFRCGYFLFPKTLMESSTFSYSPLMEEFWMYLNDQDIFHENWIEELTIIVKYPIPSFWVNNVTLSSLTYLLISGNQWGKLDSLLGNLPRLKGLFLVKDGIETLPDDIFENIPAIQTVNLFGNQLKKLPHGMFNVTDLDLSNQSSTLSLSDVDISSLENIKRLTINTRIEANFTNFFKLPHLNSLSCCGCYLQNISELNKQSWINKCLYKLDLSYNNLSSVPAVTLGTLINLESLSLSGNMLKNCPRDSFLLLRNLQYLNLSRNVINEIDLPCFSRLNSLIVLDLSWNNLTTLKPLSFYGIDHLIHLNLSHNRLVLIEDGALPMLTNLVTLKISYNNLTEVPHIAELFLNELALENNTLRNASNLILANSISYLDLSYNSIEKIKFKKVTVLNLSYNSMMYIADNMWRYLKNVEVLDLGMNDFKCCHENFTVLQSRLNASWRIIRNLNSSEPLFCYPDKQSASVFLPTFKDQDTLCFLEMVNLLLIIATPVGVLSGILVSSTVIIYYYRFEFNYIKFIFKKKQTGQQKDEIESSGCIYDAFVCYCTKNYAWVGGQLLRNLEKEPYKYRLCLHNRDFTLGVTLDKNVTESLKKSRKVICVLTNDFLASKWCRWELSMATHKMFEEGRDYIILIALEKFNHSNLPTDLQYLMDSRTYLEWSQDPENHNGTQKCWQRLRHALGDSIVKRTGSEKPQGTVMNL